MDRKIHIAFLCGIASFVFLSSLYHNLSGDELSGEYLRQPPASIKTQSDSPQNNVNYAVEEQLNSRRSSRRFSSVSDSISTVSILLPDWEVLVVVPPNSPSMLDSGDNDFTCLFADDLVSPAKPAGILPSTNQATFKCILPTRVRRKLPFLQPLLARSPVENPPERVSPAPELLRWNFLGYESLTTANDVVVFVKGLNNRQGTNRAPSDFRCVFGDNDVKTTVTHSFQEVFRCERPELTADGNESSSEEGNEKNLIKISIEITNENRVVPSVAYYMTPPRKIVEKKEKSLLCACTMVYNVAKFLKEWVMYHSSLGVGKFILYDNDSDDELKSVVEDLLLEGYNVTTMFWLWPKTQEAGFSHCAIYAKDTCTWMTYIDVDEFVYSPSWLNSSQPLNNMLKSLLPNPPYELELESESKSESDSGSSSLVSYPSSRSRSRSRSRLRSNNKIGQVMISCYEFGPSNQNAHPIMGVTQGYNCRRRLDNRHKSIVLLEAIDGSLLNAIHHFKLKEGYRNKKLRMENAVVNHYKFQAWSEFKNKFRRRVSAYVVDWTQAVNPSSKDRTPGLGFEAVEPRGWPEKFCEVYDNRLRDLTQRWFGSELSSGFRMAWQS